MPRHARVMLPGATVHVVHRGNNREPCFHSAEDRAFYLFHLERTLPRTGCALHAFVLVDNHVHLLLTTRDASGCATLMKSVAQLYAQYVSKTYRRSGYVWEGRFRAGLVDAARGYAWSAGPPGRRPAAKDDERRGDRLGREMVVRP